MSPLRDRLSSPRRLPLVLATAGLGLLALLGPTPTGHLPRATASEGAAVPAYRLPDDADLPPVPEDLRAAVADAVATLRDAPDPDAAQDAARLLAGVGAPALRHVTAALTGEDGTPAHWSERVRLLSAVAEMDAPVATPVLLAALGDPAYGVRAAAWRGLGKTGDERAAAVLDVPLDRSSEPVWRVRVEAATALRRLGLRDRVPRDRAAARLGAMLDDADLDVRRAALTELAPFADPALLPRVLDLFQQAYGPESREIPEEDRLLVLRALGAYRVGDDGRLIGALREGFLDAAPVRAVEAGKALFTLTGASVLDDERITHTALELLLDRLAGWRMREILAGLGRDAAPWLDAQARHLAGRLARGRADGHEDQLDDLVGLLIRANEARGITLLSDFLIGPDADALLPSTRKLALDRASTSLAPRLRAPLRELFAAPHSRYLRSDVLRAIATSGGDDLAAILNAALLDEDKRTVKAAITLLGQRPDLEPGEHLTELARSAKAGSVRLEALKVLSFRRRDEAVAVARETVESSDPELRKQAIAILGERPDPENFAFLVERFREATKARDVPPDEPTRSEDGPEDAPEKSDETSGDEPPGPAITHSSSRARVDRTRYDLLRALRGAGGEAARDVYLEVLAGDDIPRLRRQAARDLRGLVRPEDAEPLLGWANAETDDSVRTQLQLALAELAEVPAVATYFVGLLERALTRDAALRLLQRADRIPVPDALEAGLTDKGWNEEQKELTLHLLERAGRTPGRDALLALARGAQRFELVSEAVRLLAARRDPDLPQVLLDLLAGFDDPARKAFVVREAGRSGGATVVEPLLGLFEATRPAAIRALLRTDAEVELYTVCAVALARTGDERAGKALVRHLFEPELVRAASRLSVARDGPFHPIAATPTLLVRALVRAIARFDPDTCRRLVVDELTRLARDGSVLRLDEGYVDGVARYLRDPEAYRLPSRRRPEAGAVVRALVPRLAPRHSGLDVEAFGILAEQASVERRPEDALAAYRSAVALADVEDPLRTREKRLWEQGKLAVYEARVHAAAGKSEAAAEALTRVRAPDPESAELAYLHGYGIVKTGGDLDAARAALGFATSRQSLYAPAAFYMAWIVEAQEGPAAALSHYDRAVRLDRKTMEDSNAGGRTSRRGRTHLWSYYAYYRARALFLAAFPDDAATELARAIRLDDREALRARRDPVFKDWDLLEAVVAEGLAGIPD